MTHISEPKDLFAKIDNAKTIGDKWKIAGSYYQSLNEFNYPVIKNNQLYLFFWDEAGKSPVYFVSSLNNWNTEQSSLERISGTPLMYIKVPFKRYISFKYLFRSKERMFLDLKNSDISSRYYGRAVSVFDPIRKMYPSWMWNDRNNVGSHLDFSRAIIKGGKSLSLMHYSYGSSKCDSIMFVVAKFKKNEKQLLDNIISNLYKKFGFPPVYLILIGFEDKLDRDSVLKLLSTQVYEKLLGENYIGNKIIDKYLIASREMASDFLKFSVSRKVDFKKIFLFDVKLPGKQRRFRYALKRVATKKWVFPSFELYQKEKDVNVSYAIKKMKSAKIRVNSYLKVSSTFTRFSLFKEQLKQFFLQLKSVKL